MIKKFLIFVAILFVSACTFQTKHRGYVFPDDLETRLSGVKTISQLQEKLGDPLAKTVYGDTIWIYYGMDESNGISSPFSSTIFSPTTASLFTIVILPSFLSI